MTRHGFSRKFHFQTTFPDRELGVIGSGAKDYICDCDSTVDEGILLNSPNVVPELMRFEL